MIVCDTTEEGEALVVLIELVGMCITDPEVSDVKRVALTIALQQLRDATKVARLLHVEAVGRA